MQVAKWGNSLAVRIPADVVRDMGLKEGDEVHLARLDDGSVGVYTERQRRKAIVARMRALAGKLPPGYKFDREELYRRDADEA